MTDNQKAVTIHELFQTSSVDRSAKHKQNSTHRAELKAKKYLRRTSKQENALSKVIQEHGLDSTQTSDKLQEFVQAANGYAKKALMKNQTDTATIILQKVNSVLNTKFVGKSLPLLRYLVHQTQAQVHNINDNMEESLLSLQKAVQCAQEYEKSAADPLRLMSADTYLNAAQAYLYYDRLDEALDHSQKAEQFAEKASNSLQQLLDDPAENIGAKQNAYDAQMNQLEIKAKCLYIIGRVLFIQNLFQEALEALANGQNIIQMYLGPDDLLNDDFNQLRDEVQSRKDELDGLSPHNHKMGFTNSSQPEINSYKSRVDTRSELLKKGRIIRTYLEETDEIQNPDQRPLEDDFDSSPSYSVSQKFKETINGQKTPNMPSYKSMQNQIASDQQDKYKINNINLTSQSYRANTSIGLDHAQKVLISDLKKSEQSSKKSKVLKATQKGRSLKSGRNNKFFNKRNGKLRGDYSTSKLSFASEAQSNYSTPLMSYSQSLALQGQEKQEQNLANQNQNHYIENLMAAKRIQDEQFKLQDLLIASQPTSLPPLKSTPTMGRAHNFHPNQHMDGVSVLGSDSVIGPSQVGIGSEIGNDSDSDADSSSSCGTSSDEEVNEKDNKDTHHDETAPEKAEAPPQPEDSADEQEDDEGEQVMEFSECLVGWKTSNTISKEQNNNILESALKSVQINASPEIRQAGSEFFFRETDFQEKRHDGFKDGIKKAYELQKISKIQFWLKSCFALKRVQQVTQGKICVFYKSTSGGIVQVSVKKVLIKKTKRKHRRTIQRRTTKKVGSETDTDRSNTDDSISETIVKESSEVTGVEMVEMYEITVQNQSNSTDFKQTYINEIPSRYIMIDYLRQALNVAWQAGSINQVSYQVLSREEEQALWDDFKNLLFKLKTTHADVKSLSDQESVSQSQDESTLKSKEVDADTLARIRQEAIFVSQTELSKEQLIKKLEWEARQLLTNENVKQKRVKKIVENQSTSETIDQSDKDTDFKVIKVNQEFRDKLGLDTIDRIPGVGASQVLKIRQVIKVQALVRGFLARVAAKKSWEVHCKFFVRQHDRYFSVKVYKTNVVGVNNYKVSVTDPAFTKQTISKEIQKLPSNPIQCKKHLKDVLNVSVKPQGDINDFVINDQTKIFDDEDNRMVADDSTIDKKTTRQSDIHWNGKDEFIYNYTEPKVAGRHLVCKFSIVKMSLDVSFFIQIEGNLEKDKKQFSKVYMISVKHLNAKPGSDTKIIKLHFLPVDIKYMVYYTKHTLKAYHSISEDGQLLLDYVCLQNLQSKTWFDYQMKQIEDQIKNRDDVKRMKNVLSKKLSKIIKTQKLMHEVTIERPEGMYRVRIFHQPENFIPYTISVSNVKDVSDVDEVKIHQNPVTVLKGEIDNYLNKHIKIYLEDNGRIRYVALTDREERFCRDAKPVEPSPPATPVAVQSVNSAKLMDERLAKGILFRLYLKWVRLRWKRGNVTEFYMSQPRADGTKNTARIQVKYVQVRKTTNVERSQKKHTYQQKVNRIIKDTRDREMSLVGHNSLGDSNLTASNDSLARAPSSDQLDIQNEHQMSEQKTTEVKNVELKTMYQIKVTNVADQENTKSQFIEELPARRFLSHIFQKAIRIDWMDNQIRAFKYDRPNLYDVFQVHYYYRTEIMKLSTQIDRAFAVKTTSSWRVRKTAESKQQVVELQESANIISEADEPYLKLIVFNNLASDNQNPQTSELASRVLTLEQAYAMLHPSKKSSAQFMTTSSLLEGANYDEHSATWDKLLSCVTTSAVNGSNVVLIDETKFANIRYDFKKTDYTKQVNAIWATRLIQKNCKRYLARKRLRELRKKPGVMTISGVTTMGKALYMVFFMRANRDNFTLTLKERRNNIVFFQNHVIRDSVVQQAKQRGHEYPLVGLKEMLSELLNSRVKQAAFAEDCDRLVTDWEFLVRNILTENF